MLVLITSAYHVNDEINWLNQLFEMGLEIVHLRKPEMRKQEYEALLKAIPFAHKRKVMLHQHHELAGKYHVKGLHLREENRKELSIQEIKELKSGLDRKNMILSSSFHTMEEMVAFDGLFHYAFLSPIFQSISKPDYIGNPLLGQAVKMNKTKIIALGGIKAETIPLAKTYGFDGIAVLGAIWENPSDSLKQFKEIQSQYSQLFLHSTTHSSIH
jgi:thiamine-phosphate pyrophosphorylase